ncbi:hypothetical protein TrVFT333_011561 [Trichoderma virens FT-333]|nr:hypothetical protein TrVFT333_011561 [Trichoderma virens FT-333]
MEPTFHEIDPSGDTLLILHNANAPFAVLPSPTPQEQQKESDSAPDDKSEKDWQDTDSEPEDEESKPEDANSESKDAKNKPTIRMRLSSKHLILASAYFKKMTANNWKETTPKPAIHM